MINRFEWSEGDVEWGSGDVIEEDKKDTSGTPFEQYLKALPGRFGPADGEESK